MKKAFIAFFLNAPLNILKFHIIISFLDNKLKINIICEYLHKRGLTGLILHNKV